MATSRSPLGMFKGLDVLMGMNTDISTKEAFNDFPGMDDLVEDLPGIPEGFNTRQFSGFIPVVNSLDGGETTNFLHYWFVESQSATKNTDPVVVWLNGGPGASSLGGLL